VRSWRNKCGGCAPSPIFSSYRPRLSNREPACALVLHLHMSLDPASETGTEIPEQPALGCEENRLSLDGIDRLPDEILEHVFLFIWLSVTRFNTHRFKPVSSDLISLWKALTHCSRRWRAIAVECAVLWTDLPYLESTTWIKTALGRAQGKPLSIGVHISSSFTSQSASFELLSQMDNTRALNFRVTGTTVKGLTSLRSITAPKLEEFEVICVGSGWSETQWPIEGMFGGQAPRLQTLKIHAFIRWSSPLLKCSSITSLDLSQPRESTGPRQIEDILRSLPLLVHLTLHWTLVTLRSPFEDVHPAQLPDLRTVCLVGSVTGLAYGLACLDPSVWDWAAPPAIYIEEDGNIRCHLSDQILHLSWLAESLLRYQRACPHLFEAVEIVVHAGNSWSIHGSSDSPHDGWLEMRLQCANNQLRAPAHIFAALAALFDATSEIHVEEHEPGKAHAPSTQWTKVFQHFPNAIKVRVAGAFALSALHAIIKYQPEIDDPLPLLSGDEPESDDCLTQVTALRVEMPMAVPEFMALVFWRMDRFGDTLPEDFKISVRYGDLEKEDFDLVLRRGTEGKLELHKQIISSSTDEGLRVADA
jgi:hypothetical protein